MHPSFVKLIDYPVIDMRRSSGFVSGQYKLQPNSAGIFQSLDAMSACVRGEVGPDFAGWQNPQIQSFKNSLIASNPFQDPAFTIFDFVQSEIKYVPHPPDQQVIQDALVTIREKSGDCVSKSVLLATLLRANQTPVWFVAQCLNGLDYSHVYCEALINGKVYALDAITNEPAGWSQPCGQTGFETTWLI